VNLKQKTILFVSISIVALLVVYIGFSIYYVRTQEQVLLDERTNAAHAIAQEFTEFFTRGVDRLKLVANLPGLVYGLQTLEAQREGKQIPTWTTLHYIFYESDVFNSVYLLNGSGKVLWSEPPDLDLLDTQFEKFGEIVKTLGNAPQDVGFVVTQASGASGLDLLVVSPLTDTEPPKKSLAAPSEAVRMASVTMGSTVTG